MRERLRPPPHHKHTRAAQEKDTFTLMTLSQVGGVVLTSFSHRLRGERGEVTAVAAAVEETSPRVGGFQQMTRLIARSAGWLMCFYE